MVSLLTGFLGFCYGQLGTPSPGVLRVFYASFPKNQGFQDRILQIFVSLEVRLPSFRVESAHRKEAQRVINLENQGASWLANPRNKNLGKVRIVSEIPN
jgi:hypothetical protein